MTWYCDCCRCQIETGFRTESRKRFGQRCGRCGCYMLRIYEPVNCGDYLLRVVLT